MKAIILKHDTYKPGDLPPDGYLAWHEWAEIQRKAGIKQIECGKCGKLKTPQELSSQAVSFTAKDRRGNPVEVINPVCLGCANNK